MPKMTFVNIWFIFTETSTLPSGNGLRKWCCCDIRCFCWCFQTCCLSLCCFIWYEVSVSVVIAYDLDLFLIYLYSNFINMWLICSYGSEELLTTLVKLHDSLLPSLRQVFTLVSRSRSDASQNVSDGELQNIALSLKMLSMRIVSLGWKLVDSCYLCDENIEDSLLQTSTKMFPAKVEDPSIRGDIIIQTFKEIGEALYHSQDNTGGGTFLQNLAKNYKILSRIVSLRDSGNSSTFICRMNFCTELQCCKLSSLFLHFKTWNLWSMDTHRGHDTTRHGQNKFLKCRIWEQSDMTMCVSIYSTYQNPWWLGWAILKVKYITK